MRAVICAMSSTAQNQPCPSDDHRVASPDSETAAHSNNRTVVAPAVAPLPCVITAADAPTTRALADIAQACARDLAVPLVVQASVARAAKSVPQPAPVLTLHLPVGFAASQRQVWCLACRLACFCPSARVLGKLRLVASHRRSTHRPTQSHAGSTGRFPAARKPSRKEKTTEVVA